MTESTPEDRQEQQDTPTRDAEAPVAPPVSLEAPDADLVEQAVVVEELDEDERR